MSVAVRPETPRDRPRIHEVQRAAFGRDAEVELVDALRAAGQPWLSLVAERAGELVGHACFSPVTLEHPPQAPPAAGLGPLGVAPAAQGRGAGSALVRDGLSRCARLGWRAVFVLGDPDYYRRFGFRLAAPRGLHYESEAFDHAFQLIELVPGALDGCRGRVRYHEAFSAA